MLEDFTVDFDHSLFLNLEKVEWSGDGISNGSVKNVLKEMRSLIWLSSSGSEGDFYPVESLKIQFGRNHFGAVSL